MNRAKLILVVTDTVQKRALIKVAALLILTTVLMVRGHHSIHPPIGIHELGDAPAVLLYKKYGSRT